MKKLKLTINGNVNTFDLPENGEYKCEIEESYMPKVGDCVKVECSNTYFYWLKVKEVGNAMVKFSLTVEENLQITKNGFLNISPSRIYTQITPEELKAKYAEAGYEWDYDTDTIKPIKWIAKEGDEVWYLSIYMKANSFIFCENGKFDKDMLEYELLFKTEDECQKFADHCLSYINNKKE